MARLIACPRCQVRIDVSDVSPGASVRCPDCGQMSRVPTGNTSVRTKPAAPPQNPQRGQTSVRVAAVPAPAPAQGSERPTRTRQRNAGRNAPPPPKASKAPLIIGIAVGVIGILVGVVMLQGKSGGNPETPAPVSRKPATAKVETPETAPAKAPVVEKPEEAPKPIPAPPRDPLKANWDQLLVALRPGGGFDDPGRPEGAAFKMVKDMGKAAYPHLIRYIDHEDMMIGRAAVTVLGELTGKKGTLPNEATKAKIKTEWEAWLKTSP